MTHDTDQTDEQWVAAERTKVIDYLAQQQCQHGGVGEWPAFHVDPYFALWAVQSLKEEGAIGWWAVSGDVPTDYMSSGSGRHPREALRYFSSQWRAISDAMVAGVPRDDYMIGSAEDWPELGPLLRSRAILLLKFADDDGLWDNE
jgi:hypothetical protein